MKHLRWQRCVCCGTLQRRRSMPAFLLALQCCNCGFGRWFRLGY